MAGLALACYLTFLALGFGLRTVVHLRRTGASGFSGISGRPGSPEWFGGVLFAVALVLGLAAPILDLVGALEPLSALDHAWIAALGIGFYVLGLVATLVAQFAMGDAWRIGVDEEERTTLVTEGPFALARNPIFTAMLTAAGGLTLMVPNLVALAGFFLLMAAIELQVRLVEEPYLRRTHGADFEQYAARTGRFLPGVGRL